MTDEQIIEALECCVRYENHMACRGCPFSESGICEEDGLALQKHSLALIKRQQAEIEKLKKVGDKIDSLGVAAALMDQKERLARVKNEWEREVRAKAVREFAERLCYKVRSDLFNDFVDNLVKETTEKEGGAE